MCFCLFVFANNAYAQTQAAAEARRLEKAFLKDDNPDWIKARQQFAKGDAFVLDAAIVAGYFSSAGRRKQVEVYLREVNSLLSRKDTVRAWKHFAETYELSPFDIDLIMQATQWCRWRNDSLGVLKFMTQADRVGKALITVYPAHKPEFALPVANVAEEENIVKMAGFIPLSRRLKEIGRKRYNVLTAENKTTHEKREFYFDIDTLFESGFGGR